MSLMNFFLELAYEASTSQKEDKLAEMNKVIDWEKFRPALEQLYSNNKGKGGRPNFDVILMLKIEYLASIYDLSDAEVAAEINCNIKYRNFLGYPEDLPDKNTIWTFRTRMAESAVYASIWNELMQQIEEKGYKISKGVSVDASFIKADPGHKPADTPRGDEAKTRRNKDGTWTMKYKKSHFGYKVHTLVDNDYTLVRKLEVTTAKVHDSQIDLSEEGQIVYGDKGYFGTTPKGTSAIMQRATRGHKLGIREELRNKRISRTRCRVEHPYAVIKTNLRGGYVRVTTRARATVKVMMTFIGYNLLRLISLDSGKAKKHERTVKDMSIKLPENSSDLFGLLV